MPGCHIFTLLETLRHRVRQSQDTVLVFLDFKKAYDSVSQSLAWELLKSTGIPDVMSLLVVYGSFSHFTPHGRGDAGAVSPGAQRPSGAVHSRLSYLISSWRCCYAMSIREPGRRALC